MTEQDVQEEFLRLYTQLELLKEKNMRVGNRHLASKITAMQDAASRHDHEQGGEHVARANCKLNNMLSVATDNFAACVSETSDDHQPKTKRQSVSFAQTSSSGSDAAGEPKEHCASVQEDNDAEAANEESSIELSSREEKSESPAGSRNGRLLKSGHARTHAIVINLDDKSRFTEEVTV